MVYESVTVPVLVVTGPVGVGKTSVALALSSVLGEMGVAHAVADMDWLRWCYPHPRDDPFHIELGLRNLAAVWGNYRAAGARRLVLADVVETRATLDTYRAAIPGANILVVRLTAALTTIIHRLEERESGASLIWHSQRAAELLAQMEERRLEDILVQTEERTVMEVAREILDRAGWATSAEH